jgi:hypothetical protein
MAAMRLRQRGAQWAFGAACPREVVGARAELLQVRAGAERATRAGQHRDAHLGVSIEGLERRGEPVRGFIVERVLSFRPVDDDGGDRSAALHQDLVGHLLDQHLDSFCTVRRRASVASLPAALHAAGYSATAQ